MLKPAMMFKDRMVVQRDKPVPVWGSADPGAAVSVTMQGKTVETVTGADGKWLVKCGPFHLSMEEELVIASGGEELRLRGVAVGDVWLAGGQSNMEFHMRYDADRETEEKRCAGANIRLFDYPEVSYPEQIDEADYSKEYGFWRECDARQLERFPAVAYYFAREISEKENVPVGILACNWGGTLASSWMPEEAVIACGGGAWLDDYRAATAELDVEEYKRRFRSRWESFKTDQFADHTMDIFVGSKSEEEIYKKVADFGIPEEVAFGHIMGPFSERRPCGLYYSMLLPIVPYAVKGVIWYQGESDDVHAELYDKVFPALIRHWRGLWEEELPFLFVQLAPFRRWLVCTGSRYPEIRAAQQWTADNVSGTAMAVITDAGAEWDIHPKKKRPVGERLALLAEHYVYGEDVLCEAPRMRALTVENGKITLTFDFAGDGLVLSGDTVDSLEVYQGGYPVEFRVTSVKGNRVELVGDGIRAGRPTEARIAWRDYCEVNLKNSAGIPARPATARSV